MKKQSGIDISLNDKASKIAFNYAKKSFKNIKDVKSVTKDGDFSGGFICRGEPLCSPYGNDNINISIASDGIGTKVEIAERLNKYDSLGYDLLAMVCDDLISNFYEPKFISNILDIDYIDLNIVNELMQGLNKAAKESNVIISGGEIAELGNRINGYGKSMHFNWGATAIGFKMKSCRDDGTASSLNQKNASSLNQKNASSLNQKNASFLKQEDNENDVSQGNALTVRKQVFEKDNKDDVSQGNALTVRKQVFEEDNKDNVSQGNALTVRVGDKVYALKSNGFRSNGFSLARKILYDNYGDNWHNFKFNKYESWGSILLKPSKIYTPIIKKIIKNGVLIKKIAHITGGGFINNTNRILPDNLKINITNPISTPEYFKKLINLGNISQKQAELTWNMGYGMVIITKEAIGTSIIDWPMQYIGEIIEK